MLKIFLLMTKKIHLKLFKMLLKKLVTVFFQKFLNTCEYTKIPQNRERTFIVCFLEDKDAFLDPSKPMSTKFKFSFSSKKIKQN